LQDFLTDRLESKNESNNSIDFIGSLKVKWKFDCLRR